MRSGREASFSMPGIPSFEKRLHPPPICGWSIPGLADDGLVSDTSSHRQDNFGSPAKPGQKISSFAEARSPFSK